MICSSSSSVLSFGEAERLRPRAPASTLEADRTHKHPLLRRTTLPWRGELNASFNQSVHQDRVSETIDGLPKHPKRSWLASVTSTYIHLKICSPVLELIFIILSILVTLIKASRKGTNWSRLDLEDHWCVCVCWIIQKLLHAPGAWVWHHHVRDDGKGQRVCSDSGVLLCLIGGGWNTL